MWMMRGVSGTRFHGIFFDMASNICVTCDMLKVMLLEMMKFYIYIYILKIIRKIFGCGSKACSVSFCFCFAFVLLICRLIPRFPNTRIESFLFLVALVFDWLTVADWLFLDEGEQQKVKQCNNNKAFETTQDTQLNSTVEGRRKWGLEVTIQCRFFILVNLFCRCCISPVRRGLGGGI